MKVLFFVDTHGRSLNGIIHLSKDADAIACLGDWTVFEGDMERQLRELNSIGKPVMLIHGNHEEPSSVMNASIGLGNIHFIHKKHHILHDVVFFGYGGGGFSHTDHRFEIAAEEFMKEFKELERRYNQSYRLVLLTHAPPYGTSLDDLGDHVGSMSIRKFIEKHKPHMNLAGHIHECSGNHDKIENTMLINPGPKGIIIHF